MNVAIIGAGLIGNKRAQALEKTDRLAMVYDTDIEAAKNLAHKFKAKTVVDLDKIILDFAVDVVIVAVVNKYLAEIAVKLLEAGKHVLCEKPLGRNFSESKEIVQAALKSNCLIKTGFNHRFHPAPRKAKEIIATGSIGNILNIRARYGHGGRPGMENEWRCSKDLCGGGELLDQGVHIIDLCRWFVGDEVVKVFGKVQKAFWNIEVEDNAFFDLIFTSDVIAHCHVSWTNWRNIFSFEIFGTDGYLKIDGLGKSYGPETLEYGLRNKAGGKPTVEIIQYPEVDGSWDREWKEFKLAIKKQREPLGNGYDGLMVNKVIESIYRSSKLNKMVDV